LELAWHRQFELDLFIDLWPFDPDTDHALGHIDARSRSNSSSM